MALSINNSDSAIISLMFLVSKPTFYFIFEEKNTKIVILKPKKAQLQHFAADLTAG